MTILVNDGSASFFEPASSPRAGEAISADGIAAAELRGHGDRDLGDGKLGLG